MMTSTVFVIDHNHTLAKRFEALHPTILRSSDDVRHAFETHRAMWIASASGMKRHAAALSGSPRGDHRLFVSGRVVGVRRELLHALFRFVVAPEDGVRLLPPVQIAEVFASPQREDLFIGGSVDEEGRMVVLYRGNLESLAVPLNWFSSSSGGTSADATDFAITDFGQTVRLGQFEAAADAILYEFDAEARRRAKRRSIAKDTSFGGSLRRLRLQRGLGRDEFEGISAKEIARIERGEVVKPQARTLTKLAVSLQVQPQEIETY
jgi:Helix-turn-helix domain